MPETSFNHYSLTANPLFPPREPRASGWLKVAHHEIAFEICGPRGARPAVFLHGGPGAAQGPGARQFHDQNEYEVVYFHQPGCGNSRPSVADDIEGGLRDNNTESLISIIEQLRILLGVEKWQVFGGSWGSYLGLAYAEACPQRVSELVLRGIYLLDDASIDWLYKPGGASQVFPSLFDEWTSLIPANEHDDLIGAAYRILTGKDAAARLKLAQAYCAYENGIASLVPGNTITTDKQALEMATLEFHYAVTRGGMPNGHLLDQACRLHDIPGVIVHGQWDLVCAMRQAVELSKVWPEAQLLPTIAGHSASDGANRAALVGSTKNFAETGEEP
jgi:proline iminopeptidase